MQLIFLLIALGPYVLQVVPAARILSVFPMPLASQYAFIEPLLHELASRGHEITSITNCGQQEQLNNFRDIVVAKNTHLFDEYRNFTAESVDANYYETVDEIYKRVYQMCTNILDDPAVVQLLQNETYELIILDLFFSECFYGLSEHLQAPAVGVSSFGAVMFVDELVGNISPLSYIPQFILSIKEMNFWQRLLNVAVYCVEWVHYHYKYMPIQKLIYSTYFPNAKLTLEQAQKNFAIVLLNDHFSLTQAKPYVPNMIEVGGLNVITKTKPLAKDIKRLLDNARQGVILVVLDLDYDNTKLFLKQFAKLPHLIVWKTSQYITNKPPNSLISTNLDVSSILPHPKIKLYVVVGTSISVVESVYHGIPILGISATGKDTDYVDYIKKTGNGLSLKLHTITDEKLAKALQQLLNTNHYASVAKTLSLRFRDQQNTPMERAVYWVEYVIRHNGAAHLKNRGQNLTWWQFHNIDVLALIFALITLVIISALFILKLLIDLMGNLKPFKNVAVKEKFN